MSWTDVDGEVLAVGVLVVAGFDSRAFTPFVGWGQTVGDLWSSRCRLEELHANPVSVTLTREG